MVKDDENNYYCTKTQAGGLCVGGDTVILSWNELKNDPISAYTQPTHLIFGTVIEIIFFYKIRSIKTVIGRVPYDKRNSPVPHLTMDVNPGMKIFPSQGNYTLFRVLFFFNPRISFRI